MIPSCSFRTATVLLLATLSWSLPAAGRAQEAPERARRDENLASSIAGIREDLARLTAEIALNGLERPGFAAIPKASAKLAAVSETSGAPADDGATSADDALSDSASRAALVAAYQRQKERELRLREAAVEFSPPEAQRRLPRHLGALVTRQTANIRLTTALAVRANGPARLSAAEQGQHGVTAVEQASIEQEIALVIRTNAQATQARPEGAAPDVTTAVAGVLERTPFTANARLATELTRAGPFADAVAKQKVLLEQLNQLLNAALKNQAKAERFADGKRLTEQLIKDQEALRDAVENAAAEKPTLKERQARIDDRADVAERVLKGINAPAAERVAEGEREMEETMKSLEGEGTPMLAEKNAAEAKVALEGAADLLAQQSVPGEGEAGEDPGEPGEGESLAESENGKPADRGGNLTSPGNRLSPGRDGGAVPLAQVIGQLAPKDREALAKLKEEKSPPEYALLIQQYLRNLAESEKPKAP